MNARQNKRRLGQVLIGLFALSGSVWAQSPTGQETMAQLVQEIKQLQQQDHDLQERIRLLESRQVPTPPVNTANANPAPVPAQPAEQIPPREVPSPAQTDWHQVHGIQWHGYGEVNYKVLDQRQPELGTGGFVPGSAGNFYTGDFDLFLSSKINGKTNVLSEIAFGEGAHQDFSIDLERFLLKYDFNDHLKMSFGRYQTGIGYYNAGFRSASWVLTAIDRPLIMEFPGDGGLLPLRSVGVSITGLVPSGKLGLNYLFEYGSSDTVRQDLNGSGTVDDENNGNQLNVGLFVRPDVLPGLRIGGSFYHDKISDSTLSSRIRISQSIVNAHVVYTAHGYEILNEGFLIRHAPENSRIAFNMPAFYSQISKRFGPIRPFFRFQYVNTNKNNTIFDDVGLRYGPSFGARYELNDYVAFKAQLDHTLRGGKPNLNGLQLQLVFTF